MDMSSTVENLMQEGKGILSIGDESSEENQRLASFNVASEDARRAYRELLFTTPGIQKHLSGVILSPEALHENSGDVSFPHLLAKKNIISGVCISHDVPEEKLVELFTEYTSHGATFAVFVVNTDVSDEPLSDMLQKNISLVAKRANISQMHGLVPMLHVDVSMNGVHTAAESEDAILETLSLLSDSLKSEGAQFEKLIVGVSMAVSGSDNPARADAHDVADRTVRAITTAIGERIGGIVFLSDVQNPEESTANLNAIARLEPLPWPIAFCFSRALQDPVLAAWKGMEENIPDAQSVFEERLMLLSRADAAAYGKKSENL